MKNLKSLVLLYLILTAITGVGYPLAVTVASRVLFPDKVEGSLIRINGKVRGSKLIGQNFQSPQYFWPRPSASDYGAIPSAASNLGPTSLTLGQLIDERRKKLSSYITEPVPPDLLLASGSGLDPHISPEAALAQVDHVAKARGFSSQQREELASLVKQHTEKPQWGIFGSPRVNVLELNIALDSMRSPLLSPPPSGE